MDKTPRYLLQKPTSAEKYSVSVQNRNMDLLEEALTKIEQKNESQDQLLATKAALAECEATLTEHTATLTEHTTALTGHATALAEHETALTEHETALTEHETALTKHETALTEHETTLTKHETMLAEQKTALLEHTENQDNPHKITKAQIGLGNADNTPDTAKPVSLAQQNAIQAALTQAKAYTDAQILEAADAKANRTDLERHIQNSTIHISAAERKNWNTAGQNALLALEKLEDSAPAGSSITYSDTEPNAPTADLTWIGN